MDGSQGGEETTSTTHAPRPTNLKETIDLALFTQVHDAKTNLKENTREIRNVKIDAINKKAAVEYLVKCRTQYDKQFIQIKTVEL